MGTITHTVSILLVEDESILLRNLCMYFDMHGYKVFSASSGEDAVSIIKTHNPDIAVIDILLSDGGGDMDGFQTCQVLREHGYTQPVLFLTGKTAESDTLQGFAVGGDDYVTKPFSLPVLKARVEAHLKRVGYNQDVYQFGSVTIDLDKLKIYHSTSDTERLRCRERDLLRCFIENRGRILSRDQLLDRVWGSTSRTSNRTVDTHVRTLRKKLRDDVTQPRFIETMHGVGYQFIAQHNN